jgi:RNase P/RNase MRP subunit POP5
LAAHHLALHQQEHNSLAVRHAIPVRYKHQHFASATAALMMAHFVNEKRYTIAFEW